MTSKASFLAAVSDHKLTIQKDDGLFRHITLQAPGEIENHFHITTWPGYLCISGDSGCFVFSRIPDMFEFFRNQDSDWSINPRYWEEKVEAFDRYSSGTSEFSADLAEKFVHKELAAFLECLETERDGGTDQDEIDKRRDLATEYTQDFLQSGQLQHEASFYLSIMDRWDSEAAGGFEIVDAHDAHLKKHTRRFLWCCYAVVWAVQQYDLIVNEA